MTVQNNTGVLVIVAARNEAARIDATLVALARAFPHARLWVADDGSTDETPAIARARGARVVRAEGRLGKGGAVSRAAAEALRELAPAEDPIVLLCDGDLGASAAVLPGLVAPVAEGRAELSVAVFARPVGGGFGITLSAARWAVRRRSGLRARAPLSGQRALRASTLARLLPLAPRFGMEVGMTIDAARAGQRVLEVELDLEHRVSGRTPRGFAHRARQLRDVLSAYARAAHG